jgi:hypothetical protein
MVSVSIWRMAVARFPHPADLASLWIFYYTIPLAVLATVVGDDYGMVFLHRAAADPAIESRCIQYAALSLICLQLGRWIGTKSGPSAKQLQFPLAARDAPKAGVVIVLLLGEIALGVYLYGTDVFLSGYAIDSTLDTGNSGQALVYMAIELIGLTIAYAYLLSVATGRTAGVKISVVAIVFLLALAAVRGKRLEVVSALLSVGILLFGTRKLFRSVRGRILIVGVLIVLISTVGLLRLGAELDLLMGAFNFVAEGLFAGHALPGIIEKLDTYQVGYEYGKRAVIGLLAFIPRFIWPSKDDMIYGSAHYDDKALDGVRPLGASTILAEVVLQGGATAVIIWFGSLGYLFERLHSGLQNFDTDIRERRLSGSTIGYLVSMTIFIPHWRDGMVPSMKLAMQASVFFYALAGLSWSLPLTWGAVMRRRTLPVT